ncbi:hypothetical protein N7476_010307 [Penicillium atrosanguineum]|uniref:Uncharacterized protein n=1 Tax=Penicillium atrosanguineum TaxID=1132637 RepID=A0A9W9U169_9EURO|nr:hypothetical protein N7476_010307 [Penicillium atrosanguineum]
MTEQWMTGHQDLSFTGEHHGHGRSHHGKRERTRRGHRPPCHPPRGGGSHPRGERGDGARRAPHRPSCRGGSVGTLLLDVGGGDNLSGEVEPLAEVVQTLGGEGVVVVLPREAGLDETAGVKRLKSLDDLKEKAY